ncbi:MAG: hypothetical protein OXU26_08770 [Acidobacteriota bacterium]|nr:hypothetical protein [Acidobacteriota bacterium]
MPKLVLAVLLANPTLFAAVDLNQETNLRRFVAQVAENERKNRFREMGYVYRLQRHRIILDRRGREKKRTSSTYEVIPLDDGVYRKLIRRNGEPLSEKEARKQQRKADARLRRQRNLSPKDRARRERKQAERRRKEALFWEEAVRAFHFHYRGEEVLNGRPVAVVDLLPRENYRPPEKDLWILDKLKGRIWIDRKDLQLIQVELEFVKPVKIAGGLVARMYKGSRLWVRQEKVRDEVWFPRRFEMTMNGRIFLLKGFNMRMTGEFSDYQRFGTSVRMLPADPPADGNSVESGE